MGGVSGFKFQVSSFHPIKKQRDDFLFRLCPGLNRLPMAEMEDKTHQIFVGLTVALLGMFSEIVGDDVRRLWLKPRV
jgi:hypothetical protein